MNKLSPDNFILGLSFVVLLPLVCLAFFNHPCADDYCGAAKVRELGFFDAQLIYYNEWTGRIFSIAITSFNPILYKAFWAYKLVPLAIIFGLVYSLHFMVKTLFDTLDKRQIRVLVAFMFTLYIMQMPTIREGFYWFPAVMVYQFANILTMLFIAFLVKMLRNGGMANFLTSLVLLTAVIWSNEVSMVMLLGVVGLVTILNFSDVEKRNVLIVLLTLAIIFASFSILAPGNFQRASNYVHHYSNIILVKKMIYTILHYLLSWLPLVLIFSILLFDQLRDQKLVNKVFRIRPLPIFMFLIGLIVIGFVPFYMAKWDDPSFRIVNVIYFFFVVGSTYFGFLLLNYFNEKGDPFIRISPAVRYVLYAVVIVFLARPGSNVRSAYVDLLSGSAFAFDKEMSDRYSLIERSKELNMDTVRIKPLIHTPTTLYDYEKELGSDPLYWNNLCYADYWGVDHVIFEE